MPLLRSYAKPPPDKEAGPIPRRFIRHSVETKKRPSLPIGMGRPVFHEAKRKVLIAPLRRRDPVEVFVLGGDVEGRDSRSSSAGSASLGRRIRGSRLS